MRGIIKKVKPNKKDYRGVKLNKYNPILSGNTKKQNIHNAKIEVKRAMDLMTRKSENPRQVLKAQRVLKKYFPDKV